MGGGKAVHWGECKFINPEKCGCVDTSVPICGADLKTYGSQCAAKCLNVDKKHGGSCDSVGLLENKSGSQMADEINHDFTYQNWG